MNKNKRTLIWIMILGLILASCSTLSPAGTDELENTKWNLVFIRKSVPIADRTITIEFEDGKVHGSSGCNTYFGEYTIDGNNISCGQLAATAMACLDPEGIMEQEQEYLTFLSEVDTYSIEGEQLILKEAHQDQLTFQKASTE
ncbi:MAG: META domain-containing protein [Anaerolineaceae bacterium]|nr:META domain-containing protein [Anaerolineaceae bacterium]